MLARLLGIHVATYKRLLRLRKEAETDGEHRVAKRIHAVLLNADGKTSGHIADILKSPRSKVSEWLSNYEAHGLDALLEGQRSGRPPRLTPAQLTVLEDIVESGPVAYGLDTGVWTSPMIARVIEDEFSVSYHPGHVRKLLDQIGFSVQRPRRLLARANPVDQNRWRRRTYPNIKKKPKAKDERSSSRTRPASDKTRPSTPHGRAWAISRKSR
jgi:Transposase and inactivated derivatives